MPRYVAFLRAVNVGGRVVRMDRLQSLFAEMGFDGVETVIASGNVLFEAARQREPALVRTIEAGLRRGLGYEVATFLRSPSELARVAEAEPFPAPARAGEVVYVAFLSAPPDAAARRRLLAFAGPVDDFRVAGREVYWRCKKGMSESKFSGAVLEKTLGARATLRNTTTVRRIAAKLA